MNFSNNPKLSIITCTYNSEIYLPKALASIRRQSFRNFEHIINDSYSTDATQHIIDQYIRSTADDYPIKYVQSPPQGVAAALNVATREASGQIIHYLHSDDYYIHDDALQNALAYFDQNPHLVWLTGNFLVDIQGRLIAIPQTHFLRIKPIKALSVMNIISHENTFVKTQAVLDYGGFDEADDTVVEYRLWLKLMQDHKPLIVDDEFTAFIIHKGSTSTGSILKFSQAILRAFRSQRKEKVFPLIGYYEDKDFYKLYKRIVSRLQELEQYLDL